ncbi:GNAT family N-acetyltransferase [Streptomyces anthocyanicus]|uniref:GNAT family N-acetyltransferase n=1 Tax=Streptomyces anthocyanicus TaxID=68174 RepID=UPI003809246C
MTAWDLDDAESGDWGSAAYEGGWVQDLVRELKRSMPPDGLLGLDLAADDGLLELRYLRVSTGHRGDGHATRVLARLCAEADTRGLVLACTPTDEFGADRTRLEAFYRRHGFTPADPAHRLSEHTWQRPRTATEESAS